MAETPERLRALRDRFNLTGRYQLSFEDQAKCVLEMISCFAYKRFDLIWIRKYIAKLKTRSDLTESQKVLLAEVEDRYARRDLLIQRRVDKKLLSKMSKHRGRKKKEITKSKPADPVDLMQLWSEMLPKGTE
jgi:hypothetical protein